MESFYEIKGVERDLKPAEFKPSESRLNERALGLGYVAGNRGKRFTGDYSAPLEFNHFTIWNIINDY